MSDKHIKYPRTYHLPWSKGTKDDRTLENVDCFLNKNVIVSIKMDGENFTGYNDYCHARSIDSNNHASRNKAKSIWFEKSYLLQDNIRVCCENLYARHTIEYDNLKSYLQIISVWRKDLCLNWDETTKYSELLSIPTVDVIYDGKYNYDIINNLYRKYKQNSTDNVEGYVIRLKNEFYYEDFKNSVAKFVEPNFRQAVQEIDSHWLKKPIIPNKLNNGCRK